MSTPEELRGTPWHQHFWPWFLVVLMTISILASLSTVYIAVQHADQDVRAVSSEKPVGARGDSGGD